MIVSANKRHGWAFARTARIVAKRTVRTRRAEKAQRVDTPGVMASLEKMLATNVGVAFKFDETD